MSFQTTHRVNEGNTLYGEKKSLFQKTTSQDLGKRTFHNMIQEVLGASISQTVEKNVGGKVEKYMSSRIQHTAFSLKEKPQVTKYLPKVKEEVRHVLEDKNPLKAESSTGIGKNKPLKEQEKVVGKDPKNREEEPEKVEEPVKTFLVPTTMGDDIYTNHFMISHVPSKESFITLEKNNVDLGKVESASPSSVSITSTSQPIHYDAALNSQLDAWIQEGRVQITQVKTQVQQLRTTELSPLNVGGGEVEQPLKPEGISGDSSLSPFTTVIKDTGKTFVSSSLGDSSQKVGHYADSLPREEKHHPQFIEKLPDSSFKSIQEGEGQSATNDKSVSVSSHEVSILSLEEHEIKEKIGSSDSFTLEPPYRGEKAPREGMVNHHKSENLIGAHIGEGTTGKMAHPSLAPQISPLKVNPKIMDGQKLREVMEQGSHQEELEASTFRTADISHGKTVLASSFSKGGNLEGVRGEGVAKGVEGKSFEASEKVELLKQLNAQFKEMLHKGETHLKIKLKPLELGEVEIKLDINRDGVVRAFFKADHPDTLASIRANEKELMALMSQAGLQTDSGTMNFEQGTHREELKKMEKFSEIKKEESIVTPQPRKMVGEISSRLNIQI